MSQSQPSKTIGVVGAGLIGRLTAWSLIQQGLQVHLFDRDDRQGTGSCGFVGAGMLSPISELESADPEIAQLGMASMALWPEILAQLPHPVFFQQTGTLVVAHAQDQNDWERFRRKLSAQVAALPELGDKPFLEVTGTAFSALEPMVFPRFQKALYLPIEGQVDNRQLMAALAKGLEERDCLWYEHKEVDEVAPGRVTSQGKTYAFDWVIDCRGLGAKAELTELRGVRGEIIRVVAPEVTLNRPVRLMHPRYPLYIAPREDHHFVIGATMLESESMAPVTVQSTLELLSASFSLHSGFAEATVLEMQRHCRPAFPNHLPRILSEPGLIRVNGLYRHGFLISPKLVQWIGRRVMGTPMTELEFSKEQSVFQTIWKESASYAACH